MLAQELTASLRQTYMSIVQRIANGVEMARLATAESVVLHAEIARITGGVEIPNHRFIGIRHPVHGVPDSFDVWEDGVRVSGLL